MRTLAAVVGDEHEVLEPAAAEALAVEARLDGEHIAGDELARPVRPSPGCSCTSRPDAVAEAVEEPVLERLVGILRQLRREAVLLEELTGHAVELLPCDARANRVHRQVERLLDETVVADELLRRLAHAERPRHVGVAAGDGILRIQVGDDRLALRDRAVAGLVPDRRLLAVRDDDHVGAITPDSEKAWRARPWSSSHVTLPPSRSRSRMTPIARSAQLPAHAGCRRAPTRSSCAGACRRSRRPARARCRSRAGSRPSRAGRPAASPRLSSPIFRQARRTTWRSASYHGTPLESSSSIPRSSSGTVTIPFSPSIRGISSEPTKT